MTKNDGGPAFPSESAALYDHEADFSKHIAAKRGMSLRYYLAGQALTRIDWHTADPSHLSAIAQQCFAMSDAMLAEGEKSDAEG